MGGGGGGLGWGGGGVSAWRTPCPCGRSGRGGGSPGGSTASRAGPTAACRTPGKERTRIRTGPLGNGGGGDRDTHLAVVTLKVIILVHGHHPEDLLAALGTKPAPGF